MKSNIFKKTLLASMTSLTVFSTLNGVISTKTYAMKPGTQKSTNDSTQKPFVACSYKGYNFVIYYDELLKNASDKEKETVNQFVEAFKKVTDPYDEKIPKENIHTYYYKNVSGFRELMEYFFLIETPEDQRKCIEETILDHAIGKITKKSEMPLVKRSYKGYNFVYYCDVSSLDEKGKGMVSQYVEAFKRVTGPYNEKLPKKNEIRRVYISSFFCESMKVFCLKSPEYQREFIMNNLNNRIKKFKEKSSKVTTPAPMEIESKLAPLIN